uniref:Wall-associated receptor kinase galacturonan-binding domain-containing protein n=1 Tax=Oryza meridionalis TaxID=40149 RepID=A0A0E0BWU6_9ORYZ
MHPALLLLLLASLLHVAAAVGNETSTSGNTSCTPARCGNLTISYPFSLSGVQPVYCGYPVFDLTCDNGTGHAFLRRTFRDHLFRVDNIFYENNSLVAAVQTTFPGDSGCPVPDFNVTSSLSLYPFNISNTTKYLVFVYNCSLPRDVRHELTCANNTMRASISNQWNRMYDPGGPARAVDTVGCQYSVVPVLPWSELRSARDYAGLVRRGFLLEWAAVPGDCAACNASGGECRYDAGAMAFGCFCPSGRLQPATCDLFLPFQFSAALHSSMCSSQAAASSTI